ncbi:MAG: site-2 protease family protein [Bdellovibrionales bacterium]|nr:site-2 protease family protein [Bdellovibrionales bacterium]
MNFQEGLQRLGYQFVPFLLAVVVHEFGHGFVASLWGDKTAKEQGRLTLNPIPHIHPIGTLLFPIVNMFTGIPIMIGWANPVPIDPRRFRKFRPGLFWVSIAGVGANFITALLCAIGWCLLYRFATADFTLGKELGIMLQFGTMINFGLGIFNLIPIPPLDGSKVIESVISYGALQKYERLASYGYWILLIMMFTGAFAIFNGPIMYLTDLTFTIAGAIVGVQV